MIDPIEQSADDLNAIQHLENDEHFQGFYLRRLKQKADKLRATICGDRTVTGAELQGLRHELWALDEAINLLRTDRSLCEAEADAAREMAED